MGSKYTGSAAYVTLTPKTQLRQYYHIPISEILALINHTRKELRALQVQAFSFLDTLVYHQVLRMLIKAINKQHQLKQSSYLVI